MSFKALFIAVFVFILPLSYSQVEKEWTFLVFLNGHNNLDSEGIKNIKQMEKVGSSANINIVVQWASLKNKETKRILIQKSNDPVNMTSPVVQALPTVDMGDYKELTKFIKWTAENYPAKHYFVDVWDHGSGWHDVRDGLQSRDISHDDLTHHKITTQELGISLTDAAAVIGHKIDILGTDACLMSMIEVASEIRNSVDFMLGSEEVEPAAGWPYDAFLARLDQNPYSTPQQLGKYLTEEYVAYYKKNTTREVTLSVLDLAKQTAMEQSLKRLSSEMSRLDVTQREKIITAVKSAVSFTFKDYVDLGDLALKIKTASNTEITGNTEMLLSELNQYVIENHTTKKFEAATGVSIWWPTSKSNFDKYKATYQKLKFMNSSWLNMLNVFFG